MKKIILVVALGTFLIGCKKIQPGGNLGVLKKTDDVERYSDDEMKDEKMEAVKSPAKSDSTIVKTDTAKVSGTQSSSSKMKSVKIIPATLQSPMREQK